ncbi:hypothetical protein STEG23_028061 [Scotinomys teguina]
MCRLSWFLDPGGLSKTAAVGLYFIFPGICTLSLGILAPAALQTATEPRLRLQGQGSSAYPEPHAAGRRRSLARHLAAWNLNKAGSRFLSLPENALLEQKENVWSTVLERCLLADHNEYSRPSSLNSSAHQIVT